jgi:hypothetical protein
MIDLNNGPYFGVAKEEEIAALKRERWARGMAFELLAWTRGSGQRKPIQPGDNHSSKKGKGLS